MLDAVVLPISDCSICARVRIAIGVMPYALPAAEIACARATGKPFSERYRQRLEAMAEYVAAIMDSGGNVPMFGDADDGLVSGLSLGAGGCPFQSQLATAALLFATPSLAQAKWLRAESNHFIVYSNGDERSLRIYAQTLEAFDSSERWLLA